MTGIAAYKENSVTTQSRGRLIVMLYDGAIKFLRRAIEALERDDDGDKSKFIVKAMAIVDELDGCLNMEAGGEIAKNLRSLYAFVRGHLFKANLNRDAAGLRDVIHILEELNDGWKAVAT